MIMNGTSFQKSSVGIKEELRTKIPGTFAGTKWNSVRARSLIFIQSKEVVKLSLINSPTDVARSLLDTSLKNRVCDASGLLRVPGKWFTNTHKVFIQIRPHFLLDVLLHL